MKYTFAVALLGLVVANAQTAMRGTKVESDKEVQVDNKETDSVIFLPQGTKVSQQRLL